MNESGELVTLEEQDRSRWDAAEIIEGMQLVERALSSGRIGNYQIQASIAAVHAEAKLAEETDWLQIVALYRLLMRINFSPVVAMNHAVAVAMSGRLKDGLTLLDETNPDGKLDNYYLFHASRADLLRRLHRFDRASTAYTLAISLTTNQIEQKYLGRRLREVTSANGCCGGRKILATNETSAIALSAE
jgi:RNA polymerase sigma-70 factor (ECF subfamily)